MTKTKATFARTHSRFTGAELRAMNTPEAIAEQAYRDSRKPATTLAQIRSRQGEAAYQAALAARQPKAAPAPAPAYAKTPAVKLSPAVERKLATKGVMSAMLESMKEEAAKVAPAPETKPARDTLKAVRADMAAEFATVRTEMRQGFDGVHDAIQTALGARLFRA